MTQYAGLLNNTLKISFPVDTISNSTRWKMHYWENLLQCLFKSQTYTEISITRRWNKEGPQLICFELIMTLPVSSLCCHEKRREFSTWIKIIFPAQRLYLSVACDTNIYLHVSWRILAINFQEKLYTKFSFRVYTRMKNSLTICVLIYLLSVQFMKHFSKSR